MSPDLDQAEAGATVSVSEKTAFPNLWQGIGMAITYLALSSWLGSLVALAAEALHFPPWVAMIPGLLLGFPMALAFGLWLGHLDLWDILSFQKVRPGIWISALLFTVAHGNPLQFPVAIMIGACAGWYYQATGSLWPGLVAHGLHNLLIGLTLEPQALASNSLVVSPLPPLAWILASPFLAFLGLLWLRWQLRLPKEISWGVLSVE